MSSDSVVGSVVPLVFVAAPALACAGRTGASSREGCVIAGADTVHLATGPVYRDCAVDTPALLLNPGVRIDYRPPSGARPRPGSQCYGARLVFVVDQRGMPEVRTARVVQASDPELGTAVLQTLAQWRYQPAQKDGVPVRQIVQAERNIAMVVAVVRQGDAVSPPPRRPNC